MSEFTFLEGREPRDFQSLAEFLPPCVFWKLTFYRNSSELLYGMCPLSLYNKVGVLYQSLILYAWSKGWTSLISNYLIIWWVHSTFMKLHVFISCCSKAIYYYYFLRMLIILGPVSFWEERDIAQYLLS